MNEIGNGPCDKNYKPSGISMAESRALEAYPYFPTEVNLFGHKTITADGNSHYRSIFIKGYEQSEQDLALTWEDIRTITKILEEIVQEDILVEFYNGDAISCYKEVLRRFQNTKKDED